MLILIGMDTKMCIDRSPPATRTDGWRDRRLDGQTDRLTRNILTHCSGLDASTISRILCIDRSGGPTSIVATPSLADEIGPMVLPHAMSWRITKSYNKADIIGLFIQCNYRFAPWIPSFVKMCRPVVKERKENKEKNWNLEGNVTFFIYFCFS